MVIESVDASALLLNVIFKLSLHYHDIHSFERHDILSVLGCNVQHTRDTECAYTSTQHHTSNEASACNFSNRRRRAAHAALHTQTPRWKHDNKQVRDSARLINLQNAARLTLYFLSQNIALEKQIPPTTFALRDSPTSELISDSKPRNATVRIPRRRAKSPRALHQITDGAHLGLTDSQDTPTKEDFSNSNPGPAWELSKHLFEPQPT